MNTLAAGNRANESYAVATHGLCRRYGHDMVLDHIDLKIPEGAVYVLVGANGAGKSTLFRILMNLVRPSAGRVEVFGLDTANDSAMVRAQVGYVAENHDAGYRSMSCARLLAHVSAYFPSWDSAYADALIRAFDVHLRQKVGALSKGGARRLQLVMALAHRPPLLLLDEPMDGLDAVVRKRTMTLIAEHLADTPTTVLVSTHQIHDLESLADHLGVLRQGRLVAQFSTDELRRTVRRYSIEVPEGWEAPSALQATDVRRARSGREVRCTLVGESSAITEQLLLSGAQVLDSVTLSLEDAALAFLGDESVS